MTITREQLEKAAKAAGLDIVQSLFYPCLYHENCTGDFRCLEVDISDELIDWNPMHDHGQLHDLAMACKIAIEPRTNFIIYDVGSKSKVIDVNCQDFPTLAEAVILAACEQFDAKGGLTP